MPNVDYTLEKFTDSRKPGEKIPKARQTAYDLMSFLFKVRQNIHVRETNEGKNVSDLRTEIDSLMALMKTYWQTASVADKQEYQLRLNTKKRLLSSAETKRSLASNAYYILLELTYELTELYNDARYREIIKCISKKRLAKSIWMATWRIFTKSSKRSKSVFRKWLIITTQFVQFMSNGQQHRKRKRQVQTMRRKKVLTAGLQLLMVKMQMLTILILRKRVTIRATLIALNKTII